ncbi:rna-binding protein [Vairimorpha ceranae]|uniref:Rna-binding protein n=1 Tax=Vairimorpha ceranae TaxID=40302 RepID=A0A0F9WDI2_9MICR|nr:rna-binding protein [Vairimorpha ceranae]KAF5139941.1 hypothetical protein G9O61_00g018610 [Vairimorpha ceranae]KKO74850.1 rna-binding protein [Vairimorpha ceranae]
MPKIIVSNLPPNFTVEDTRTIYEKYGLILNITKSEKNYFITYKNRNECATAINSTNGKVYNNCKPLIVDYAYDRDSKVFIFNLPLDSDLVDVTSYFSYYGKIEHSKFIKNVLFIVFENKKDAIKLLDLNNKIHYKDKLLNIRNTLKSECMYDDSKCVFVYNVPEDLTEMDFLRFFSKYGCILSSGIKNNKGFINYEREIGAYKAVKYGDGLKIKNKKIRVTLKGEKRK